MNKEGILKEIKNSNLTEECKTEVIQIIEQYDKNRAEEIFASIVQTNRNCTYAYKAVLWPFINNKDYGYRKCHKIT